MTGTDWLKNLDLQRWWISLIAVGVTLAVGALAANNPAIIMIGLSIVAFGFGEWMNHRMEKQILHGGTLTTYERVNRPLGLALDALGFALMALGLYRLVTS